MSVLERFVVILYDRASAREGVNEGRKVWLRTKEDTLKVFLQETMPFSVIQDSCITSGPLLESLCGIVDQISIFWRLDWSSGLWVPLLTTLPEASKVCQQLWRCGSKVERGCPVKHYTNLVVLPKMYKNDLSPLGPEKWPPGEIWDDHEAKINQLIECCYKDKFGAFNPKCMIVSSSSQIATHPSPLGQEKNDSPGWIWNGPMAKIDQNVNTVPMLNLVLLTQSVQSFHYLTKYLCTPPR